jgi:pimeloyl-ACP methyl ester carboxylesterase
MSSLLVGSNGVSFSYIDTGKPSNTSYTTIFAVPGMGSTAHIYDKIHAIAPAAGVRFVSINRRGYGSTSAYTGDEIGVITQGTDEQRTSFLTDRGHEIAFFIDAFIQKHNLPPISLDGKTGGAVLVGWSLGNAVSLATIAYADSLPSDVQSRLAGYIRGLVLHEPASNIIGFDMPPKNWAPLIDTSLPEELRVPVFNQWVTSYFKHGDLSKRDVDSLSYILPATFRPPSVFTMSEEQVERNLSSGSAAVLDLPFIINFTPQFLVSFRKAVFDAKIRAKFSKMRVSYFSGDVSPSWGPATLWMVEDEARKHDGVSIHCQFIHGFNHFAHWDEPEKTLQVYLSGVS